MKINNLLLLVVLLFASCSKMNMKYIDSSGNSYSQALEVRDFKKLVFVSGQIPSDENGNVPADFGSQCQLVWKNIENQLKKANLSLSNIIKVNTYLSDIKYREENFKIRHQVLGNHQPALTVIIADIYDHDWLLEIEVIAAE
jgi:2-iminobutanoate/2-iminopropanoate deaminase